MWAIVSPEHIASIMCWLTENNQLIDNHLDVCVCYITSWVNPKMTNKNTPEIHDVQEVWSKWSFNLEKQTDCGILKSFNLLTLCVSGTLLTLHCIVITEWGAGILTRFLQVKIILEVIFKLQSAIILTEVNF